MNDRFIVGFIVATCDNSSSSPVDYVDDGFISRDMTWLQCHFALYFFCGIITARERGKVGFTHICLSVSVYVVQLITFEPFDLLTSFLAWK